ncbi:MAG: hypothetical protein NTZ78_09385 [Candidatus Aureabacteria bacterium]|nr:hypothetical protein [Candidatus Auribacterota bacterium]
MSNHITRRAYEAFIEFTVSEGHPTEREELQKKSKEEMMKIVHEVNEVMECRVKERSLKRENMKKLHIEELDSEWILYRYPERHGGGENSPFVC